MRISVCLHDFSEEHNKAHNGADKAEDKLPWPAQSERKQSGSISVARSRAGRANKFHVSFQRTDGFGLREQITLAGLYILCIQATCSVTSFPSISPHD